MTTEAKPMIQANELRIGNLVYKIDALIDGDKITYQNRYSRITANDIYHIVEDGDPTNHPIHLTPEILEKCGFDPFLWNTDKSIKISWNTDIAYVGNNFSTSGFHVTGIKYLHQLQNLYFALTGEELTVNL